MVFFTVKKTTQKLFSSGDFIMKLTIQVASVAVGCPSEDAETILWSMFQHMPGKKSKPSSGVIVH
jgi:hypothetical protein